MKPIIKPISKVSTRLLLAALFWNIAAAMLAAKGLNTLLTSTSFAIILLIVLLALAMGLLKSRFILDSTAQKAAMRIRTIKDGCAFGFFSLKSWAMILTMIGLGRLLCLLHIHPKAIGLIYLTIATALLVSSRIFWREYRKKLPDMP